MLHRGGIQAVAQFGEPGFALGAFGSMGAHLDQLVRPQAPVDLAGDGLREAALADARHGMQWVGARAQGAALRGGEFDLHGARF